MESHKIPWFQTINQIGSNWDVHRRVDHKRGVPSMLPAIFSLETVSISCHLAGQTLRFALRVSGQSTSAWWDWIVGISTVISSPSKHGRAPSYTMLHPIVDKYPIPVCFIILYCSHLCWLTRCFVHLFWRLQASTNPSRNIKVNYVNYRHVYLLPYDLPQP